jgi:predicted helicase
LKSKFDKAEGLATNKEAVPILVVLGNPPYSGSSENKSEFIEHLMDTYKEDVREEKNLQPLSNDYIKFIRFGHWKIEQAGRGILGFITSNSYLSGMVHRGMRRRLLQSFDEIYILNLHGSSRIGEKTPEGSKDENVFDIQQGVAISIYVKKPKPAKQKKVFYADVWGSRREKYRYLATSDVELTRWQKVTPKKPFYFFVPKNFALLDRYQKFWSLTDIFRQWSSAVKTHRDHLVVGFTKRELVELHLLKHPALGHAEVGYPSEGSDKVDFVRFNESAKKVFINKQQYFDGVSKEVWEYRIGAYQVMEKYLKDRKGRKLLPDEINHYTKMARAIGLTIELQEKIDKAYPKVDP